MSGTILLEKYVPVSSLDGPGTYQGELTVLLVRRDQESNKSRVGAQLRLRKLTAGTGRWSAETNYWWMRRDRGRAEEAYIADGNLQYNFDTVAHDGVPGMGGWILVSAVEFDVVHDADGSRTLRLEAHWNDTAGNLQAFTIDETVTLPPLPRASKVSASPSPQVIGKSVKIALERASEMFTHDLSWESGELSGVIAAGVPTECTFVADEAILDEWPGRSQAPVTITAVTKNGSTVIGTSQTTLMLKPVPLPPVVGGQQFPFDLRARRVVRVAGEMKAISGEIHASRMTHSDVASGTSSLKLEWSERADVSVSALDIVHAEAHDGHEWDDAGWFVMMRDENDDANEARMHTYSGIDYVDFILGRGRVQPASGTTADPRTWSNITPGALFAQLIAEGKSRGWGSYLEVEFTGAQTSDGAPWAQTIPSVSAPLDQPYLALLQQLVEAGQVEYRTSYRDGVAYLELHNPGTGSDWAVEGADPIVNLANALPSRAPRRATRESMVTRMTGSGEGELRRAVERPVPAELAAFGHLEGAIAAGDVKTATELDRIVQAGLEDASTPVEERTFLYPVSAAPRHLWPYFTYRSGDWVLVPAADKPVRMRVAQITLTKDDDGSIEAAVVVGDRIVSGLAGVARRQAQAAAGAIPGGSGRAPQRLDASIPAAPVLAPLTSEGYWDSDGAAKSVVTVPWAAVTAALDGSDLDVAKYELYTRKTAVDQWGEYTSTSALSYGIPGLDVNAPLQVRARAVSATGVAGEWSEFRQIITAEPAAPTVAPSDPTPTADAVGTVSIGWDGLIGAMTPPPQFAYLLAEISLTEDGAYSPAGQQLLAAGAVSVANVGPGDYWTRLRWYDRLGHASAPSTAIMVTVEQLPFDERQPAAPGPLVVDSDAEWTASEPQARLKASWPEVTVDVDDEPIDVILYELWGRLADEPAPRLLTASATLQAAHAPVAPGSDWMLSARAQSATRVWGPWSAEVPVTAAAPAFDLTAPSAPTLTAARGVIHVTSDGTLVGPPPITVPTWVTHFLVETALEDVEEAYAVAETMPRGSWRSQLTGHAIGSMPWVRLRAVDRLRRVSPPSESRQVLVVGITGPDLEANSVSANHIAAGSIQVDHVSPSFGRDLVLDGNVIITATSERIDDVETGAAATAAALAAQRMRYGFNEVELLISQPGSPMELAIDNERVEFRESGIARAFLSAGQWNAESIVTRQLVMGRHVIEHDGTGLIFRRS